MPPPPGATKRQKEMARKQKQQEKDAKREVRKQEKAQRTPRGDGIDPDIADIIPGPQPPLDGY